MNPRRYAMLFIGVMLANATMAHAQTEARIFTHADSLRGGWTMLRWCYDVTFYHLDIRIDPSRETVEGSNDMQFSVLEESSTFQVDLFKNMYLQSIVLDH